ncbi:MAG: hypothetical protein L6Q78_01950 [Bacteroidia bacterium]|nr:hypothetical protein [Bacteroidia bacterium]
MKFIYTYILLLISLSALAQDKKVEFFGAGRFSLNNSNLTGKLIESDTTTARKQLNGATLFDLGFHIRPNAETEIKAITRVQNDLNGFWGAGINFYLRELYLRGLLLNRISYQVGDLNTRMTPYTLFNQQVEMAQGNPMALETFREIIQYDRFYGENSWRQQGAQAEMTLDLQPIKHSLQIKGLIAKNRQTDFFSKPDRLFAGASLELKNNYRFKLNYDGVRVFDIPKSAMFSDLAFLNIVHQLGLSKALTLAKNNFLISAQAGLSQVEYQNDPLAPKLENGAFNEFSLAWKSPDKSWSAQVEWRAVETGFRSMGAQSRSLNLNALTSQYAYITNRESQRALTLAEVLTDGAVYQSFLNPELQRFHPAFENINPYGKATPNRQGVSLKAAWDSKVKGNASVSTGLASMKEITGQGTTNLRSFLEQTVQANVKLSSYVGMKRKWNISLWARQQQTKRDGQEGIDAIKLTSTQLKFGTEVELLPKLDIQLAWLNLTSEGNEFLAERNSYNQVVFFQKQDCNLKQSFLIGGLNYQFSEQASLKIQYQQIANQQDIQPNNAYQINRLAILYNLFF